MAPHRGSRSGCAPPSCTPRPGPLVPALHSYWIWIHVTAMTVAIGSYNRGGDLHRLVPGRGTGHAKKQATSQAAGFGAVLDRLPSADALDRLSYRTVIFAFPDLDVRGHRPGAIWADQAWGRYWGWGPEGDLGVHHLGCVRRLPARPAPPGDGGAAGPPYHPVGRVHQPGVQPGRRQPLDHRPALLRRHQLTRAPRRVRVSSSGSPPRTSHSRRV